MTTATGCSVTLPPFAQSHLHEEAVMAKATKTVAGVIGMVIISAFVLGGCMSMRDESMMMKKDDSMMDKK
ncbi:MAG: hypothetical protein AUG80_18785 [Candidatus Rokubacteria bacterium 13_1_20CM_4_68_9]|nr:MAG: hypothetical protein AUG80_18785 [Candidatus Rokubacteria bacterium 13_1_20CM_4_68_9]